MDRTKFEFEVCEIDRMLSALIPECDVPCTNSNTNANGDLPSRCQFDIRNVHEHENEIQIPSK